MKKAAVPSILVAVVLLALGVTTEAQQTGKMFRIGFLDRSTGGSAVYVDAFRQELSKLGWIEGKNITIEYRFAEGKTDRLPELAAELVRLKVDLIVTTGRVPALAAKNATTTIPIVMMANPDPVGEGLVASLARPGGNVTGFSGLSIELSTKRLEILREAVPKLTRVGFLRQVTRLVTGDLPVKDLRAAAPLLKLKIGGDRGRSRRQRIRESVSHRKGEAGGRDYDRRRSPLFRRKKADRRACRQIPVSCYLPTEGIRR